MPEFRIVVETPTGFRATRTEHAPSLDALVTRLRKSLAPGFTLDHYDGQTYISTHAYDSGYMRFPEYYTLEQIGN